MRKQVPADKDELDHVPIQVNSPGFQSKKIVDSNLYVKIIGMCHKRNLFIL